MFIDALIGGIGGAVSRTAVAPIELFRIQRQNHLLIQSIIIYIGFFGALLLVVTNTIEITNIPINTDTIGDILRRNQPIICILSISSTLYKKIRG